MWTRSAKYPFLRILWLVLKLTLPYADLKFKDCDIVTIVLFNKT